MKITNKYVCTLFISSSFSASPIHFHFCLSRAICIHLTRTHSHQFISPSSTRSTLLSITSSRIPFQYFSRPSVIHSSRRVLLPTFSHVPLYLPLGSYYLPMYSSYDLFLLHQAYICAHWILRIIFEFSIRVSYIYVITGIGRMPSFLNIYILVYTLHIYTFTHSFFFTSGHIHQLSMV
jgi:hypothetical protein